MDIKIAMRNTHVYFLGIKLRYRCLLPMLALVAAYPSRVEAAELPLYQPALDWVVPAILLYARRCPDSTAPRRHRSRQGSRDRATAVTKCGKDLRAIWDQAVTLQHPSFYIMFIIGVFDAFKRISV